MRVRVTERGGFRLNHWPNFRDVYEGEYKTGQITEFGVLTYDPLVLDGTCKVVGLFDMYPLQESDFIPIFYTCKRAAYGDEGTAVEANNSLRGAPMAFRVGDNVRVLMKAGVPDTVVTFAQGPPRMCKDVFQIAMRSWFPGSAPGDNLIHYSLQRQGLYSALNEECLDTYGHGLQFNLPGIRLFGQREFQLGTVINYWGDWLVRIGPVALIIQIHSVGLPGPYTGFSVVWAAVWSKEAEAEWIAHGQMKEATIPTNPLAGIGGISQAPYLGMTHQTAFSAALDATLGGVMRFPYPRWVLCELNGQQWPYEQTL